MINLKCQLNITKYIYFIVHILFDKLIEIMDYNYSKIIIVTKNYNLYSSVQFNKVALKLVGVTKSIPLCAR